MRRTVRIPVTLLYTYQRFMSSEHVSPVPISAGNWIGSRTHDSARCIGWADITRIVPRRLKTDKQVTTARPVRSLGACAYILLYMYTCNAFSRGDGTRKTNKSLDFRTILSRYLINLLSSICSEQRTRSNCSM